MSTQEREDQDSGGACWHDLTENTELLEHSLPLGKSAVISPTPYLWNHFCLLCIHASWVADLDTAPNSCPPAQACNFKTLHSEPVKTVVCKREGTQSRSLKDSATLFIAGGRHENCVQSLKDCSKEIQVPLAPRWWGAFNSSPCKGLPSCVHCCLWAEPYLSVTAPKTAATTILLHSSLLSATSCTKGSHKGWYFWQRGHIFCHWFSKRVRFCFRPRAWTKE